MAGLAYIESIERARQILAQDAKFVINMDKHFRCWIQTGELESDGLPIGRGPFVAEISGTVFDTLIEEMEQKYCSEFYQKI